MTRNQACNQFSALVNGGDYRGTYCCTCGEKETDHSTAPAQTTFRIGYGRSSYDPQWSPSQPWSVVVNGTVICYKHSAYAAELDLRRRGCVGETVWSA